jgi:hypothetical protein
VLVTEGIGGYWRYAWYDEDKVYISRRAETSLHNLQWTIPNNAHYVRLSYPIDSQPKFEKGNKATDWTPAPEDVDAKIDTKVAISTYESKMTQLDNEISLRVTENDLISTGIDITSGVITLYSGVGGTGGKIIINGSNFSVDADGKIKANSAEITGIIHATSGEFTGTITSNSGVLAGWEFTTGRIGKVQSPTSNPTNNGLSLYDSFIKFSESGASVFIGTNVAPAVLGMPIMARFIHTNPDIAKIGMYFDIAGSDTSFWDGSSNNVAIRINRGVVSGLRLNGVNHNLTSYGYTIGSETVVAIYNTQNYVVKLPANPEAWEFKWITSVNNIAFTLHGNGKNIWSPYQGLVASLLFNKGVIVYTGREWIMIAY